MVGPTGKKGCGIVGKKQHNTKTTLPRWTLPFNFRAHCISPQTRQMLNVGDGNAILHNETTPARIKTQRDNSVQKQYREDTSNSVKIQEHFKVFTPLDGSIESLHSIAIKDVATPEIRVSRFSMEELGQSQLYTFDEERLVNVIVKFRDRLPKSNSLTLKSL